MLRRLRQHFAVEFGDDALSGGGYTHIVVGKEVPAQFFVEFEQSFEDRIDRPALIGFDLQHNTLMDAYWSFETTDERLVEDVRRLAVQSPSVLVVDDSPTTRMVSEAVLKGFGLHVFLCDGGHAAVAMAESQRVSAALIDLEMPDLDGISTVKAIRKMPRYRSTPLVALTAHSDEPTRRRCLDAGYTAFLHKPFNQSALKSLFGQAFVGSGGGSIAPPPITNSNLVVVEDPDIAELFPMFLESRFSDCEPLKSALKTSDYEAIRRIAHRAKGASATYSFPTLTELSSEIGRCARNQLSSDASSDEELTNVIQRYITHLHELVVKTDDGEFPAIDFKPS